MDFKMVYFIQYHFGQDWASEEINQTFSFIDYKSENVPETN